MSFWERAPLIIPQKTQPNGRESAEFFEEIIKTAQTNGEGQFEWVFFRRDGSEFLVKKKLSTIFSKGEELIFTNLKDITQKRTTGNLFTKNEECCRQISENIGSVLWELDSNGLFTYLGPPAKKVFGVDPEEFIGKKYAWELFQQSSWEMLKKTTTE